MSGNPSKSLYSSTVSNFRRPPAYSSSPSRQPEKTTSYNYTLDPGYKNVAKQLNYTPAFSKTTSAIHSRVSSITDITQVQQKPKIMTVTPETIKKYAPTKTERERDLEMKLTMMLASNDKLNQQLETLMQPKKDSPIKVYQKEAEDVKTQFSKLYTASTEQKKHYEAEINRLKSDILFLDTDLRTANMKIQNFMLEKNVSRNSPYRQSSPSPYLKSEGETYSDKKNFEERRVLSETADLKSKINRLTNELSEAKKVSDVQDSKLKLFKFELDKTKDSENRLISELNEKSNAHVALGNKYKELSIKSELQKKEYSELKGKYKQLEASAQGKIDSAEENEKNSEHFKKQISELNEKIAIFNEEKQKFQIRLDEKTKENESLQSQIKKVTNQFEEIDTLMKSSELISKDDYKLLQNFKEKATDLNQDNINLSQNIKKLQGHIDSLQREKESFSEVKLKLEDQIDSLSTLNERISRKNKSFESKIQFLEEENENFWQGIEHFKQKLIQTENNKNEQIRDLNSQIEMLKTKIAQKDDAIKSIKDQEEKSSSDVAQLRNLVQELNVLNEKLQGELSHAMTQVEESNDKAASLHESNAKIKILEEKVNEISRLESKVEELSNSALELEIYKAESEKFSVEIRSLKEDLAQKTRDIEESKSTIDSLRLKESQLKSENDDLRKLNDEIAVFKEENLKLLSKIDDFNKEVETVKSENTDKLTLLNKELNRNQQLLENAESNYNELNIKYKALEEELEKAKPSIEIASKIQGKDFDEKINALSKLEHMREEMTQSLKELETNKTILETLETENRGLVEIIAQKDRELDEAKLSLSGLENLHSTEIQLRKELEDLNKMYLEAKNQEKILQDEKSNYELERAQLNSSIDDLNEKLGKIEHKFEDQSKTSTEELNKTKQLLENAESGNNNLSLKCKGLEEELEKAKPSIELASKIQSEDLEKKINELSKLENTIGEMSKSLEELERYKTKADALEAENIILKTSIAEKTREVEDAKIALSQLDNLRSTEYQLRKDLENLNKNLLEIKHQEKILQDEKSSYELERAQLNASINDLNEKLKLITNEHEDQSKGLTEELNEVKQLLKKSESDNNDLNLKIKTLEEEANVKSSNNVISKIEIKDIEQKIQDLSQLEHTIDELYKSAAELEKCKSELEKYQTENKIQNDKLTQNAQDLKDALARVSEYDSLVLKHNQLSAEFDKLKEKSLELKDQEKLMQDQLDVITDEKSQLLSQVQTLNNQLESIKIKNEQFLTESDILKKDLQNKTDELTIALAKIYELEERNLKVKESDIEINYLKEENEIIKKSLELDMSPLKTEIQKLNEEISKLNIELGEKNNKLSEENDNRIKIEEELKIASESIFKTQNMSKDLDEKIQHCVYLEKTIDDLKLKYNDLENANKELHALNEVASLNDSLSNKTKELEQAQEKIALLEKQLETQKLLEEDIEKFKSENQVLSQEKSKSNTELLEKLEKAELDLQDKIKELSLIEKHMEDNGKITAEFHELKEGFLKISDENYQLKKSLAHTTADYEQSLIKIEELEESLSKIPKEPENHEKQREVSPPKKPN